MKCGKELSDENQEYCRDCLHKKHLYDRGDQPVCVSVKKGGLPVQICGQAGIRRFFRKRDGMAFGAADPFLEGDALSLFRCIRRGSAKRLTIRRSFWHWKIGKQLGAPGENNNWLIRIKKYSSAEAFKWAGTPK